MYIPIWLITIAVIVFLIYKRQKPYEVSKAETKETITAEIERKESYLLRKIKGSHLKDYMQTEALLFDCGKKNLIRLNERFKHDDIKLGEVIKDWIDYMDALSDIISAREQLDVSTTETSEIYYKELDELYIKIQETHKRFKDLLGNNYCDPDEIEKLRIKESNVDFIVKMESDLLSFIETNPLKDFMATERAEFDSGKKNFSLLNKLFKHDDTKLAKITKDWIDFMNILREGISTECLLLSASTDGEDSPESMKTKITLNKKRRDIEKQFEETKKHFKNLLGDEYVVAEEELKKDIKENTKKFVDQEESVLLNQIRDNRLNDYINREASRFDFHRKNFILLSERFEGDTVKLEQISSHWLTYMDILREAIKQSLIVDLPVDAFTDSKDGQGLSVRSTLYITREKMERYFKDLLGADYLDFEEFEKSNSKH